MDDEPLEPYVICATSGDKKTYVEIRLSANASARERQEAKNRAIKELRETSYSSGVIRCGESTTANREYASAEAETRAETALNPATPPLEPPEPTPNVSTPPDKVSQPSGDTPSAQGALGVADDDAEGAIVLEHQPDRSVGPQSVCGDAFWRQDSTFSSAQVAGSCLASNAKDHDYRFLEQSIRRNEPTVSGEPHPSHGMPFGKASNKEADPVDLCTGTFTLDVVDLSVPTATSPIDFRRCYRSGRPYFGPFGYGWDHSFNVYLRELNDARIAMWDGQLNEQYFWPKGFQTFECTPTIGAIIEPLAFPLDGYVVTFRGGTRWTFHQSPTWSTADRIPLVSIADRHGNTRTLTYDADDCVSSVLDDAGRGLVFRYGDCGLLEEVADHTGTRAVRYYHQLDSEHVERVIGPPTAEFPDGPSTWYEYDAYNPHPAMQHNIVRVSNSAAEVYLQNDYAPPGEGFNFNRVIRQTVGDDVYEFDYEQIQWVAPVEEFIDYVATRTITKPPDNSLHTYAFNYRGDLLEHRFRLVADGSYDVVAARWSYDRQGNVTQAIAPDGAMVAMTFDDANPDPRARFNLLRLERIARLPGPPSRVILELEPDAYDPDFQLPQAITDETGAVTTYVYDFNQGVVNPTGRLVEIQFPEVTLPDGSDQQSVARFEWNERGQPTAVTAPEGTRVEFDYIGPGGYDEGFLAGTTRDPGGAALRTGYQYDAVGQVRSVIDPLGHETVLRSNAFGQVEELTLPAVAGLAPTRRMWFGDDGSPVRVARPRGDYQDSVIVGDSIIDVAERDLLGRLTGARLASNTERPRLWRQHVDHEGRPTRVVDPLGDVTERRYDERGLLLRVTQAPGAHAEVSRYGYDVAGRLRRTVAPGGWETAIGYDDWERPERVTLPNGSVRVNRWGPRDVLLEAKVEHAGVTLSKETYEYDERGRLTGRTVFSAEVDAALGVPLTTRFTYDRDDRLRRVETDRAASVEFTFDGVGRLTDVVETNGTQHEFAYTDTGALARHVITETEAGVLRTVAVDFEYDERSRLATTIGPSGRCEYAYDQGDLLVVQHEPGDVSTTMSRDAFGAVVGSVLDGGGLDIRREWRFDDLGRLVRFVDPTGDETAWQYDGFGRIRVLTLPDGSAWRYAYANAGHVVEQLSPAGSTVTTTMGANQKPVKVECVAGVNVDPVAAHEYTYDGLGRLVRASTPTDVVERGFDTLGRLVSETTNDFTITVERDDANGTVDLVYPDGRRERTHTDALGRPTSTTVVAVGVELGGNVNEELLTVDYAGSPAVLAHSNGVDTVLSYDRPGRLVEVEHSRDGLTLDGHRTRYDARARRAVVQYTGAPPSTTMHTFDARDRLTGVLRGVPLPALPDITDENDHAAAIVAAAGVAGGATDTESYDLDQSDGRRDVRRTDALGVITLDTNTLGPDHRVTSADGTPVGYSPDGIRTDDGRREYDSDVLGRIVRVRDVVTGNVIAEFDYDSLSRVARGTVNGVPFSRAFLGAEWIHERRGGDVRQATPHPLWPQPLCVAQSTGTYFLHATEGLSTLCVTDAAGTIQEHHRYGPFGAPGITAGDGVTTVDPVDAVVEPRWQGMPFVAPLGLYTATARVYDPELGVFLSRDPLLYCDSPSPWVYGAHNPVDFADPSGLAISPLGDASGQPFDPMGFVNDWSIAAMVYGAGLRRTAAAFQPRDAKGVPLEPGPIILYTDTPGQRIYRGLAEDWLKEGKGSMIQRTIHAAKGDEFERIWRDELAKLDPQRYTKNARLPQGPYNDLWGEVSRKAVRDATMGGGGAITPNDVTNLRKDSIQVLHEIPAYRQFGTLMGSLHLLGGGLTIAGAVNDPNEYRADIGYAAGAMQLSGAGLMAWGARNLGPTARAFGLGRAVSSAGGYLTAPITLWQGYDDLEHGADEYTRMKGGLTMLSVAAPELGVLIGFFDIAVKPLAEDFVEIVYGAVSQIYGIRF